MKIFSVTSLARCLGILMLNFSVALLVHSSPIEPKCFSSRYKCEILKILKSLILGWFPVLP